VVEQGVSGSKPWRTRTLGKAIEACELGKAGGIVVAWQDRLSRENGLATAEVWEALDDVEIMKAVGPDRFKQKLAEYVEALEQAEQALEVVKSQKLRTRESLLGLAVPFLDAWETWTMERRREFLQKNVRHLIVRPTSMIVWRVSFALAALARAPTTCNALRGPVGPLFAFGMGAHRHPDKRSYQRTGHLV
jgi:hypothetical protein